MSAALHKRAPAPVSASTEVDGAAAQITVRGLCKRFGPGVLYQDFALDVLKRRITCVFGPNGCGKSTLINMMAGLVAADAGSVLFEGKPLAAATIGYVFQNYRDALFPWLRARDNIAYPLAVRGVARAERQRRVDELVATLGVEIDLHRYPYELSGGQQQLVSIMRALAPRPEVLFLDEPFSALDYEMTLAMRDRLQDAFAATGTTMVVVSHDLEEAVFLADQVVLLTRRPTRVAEIVDVALPRPRRAETLSDDRFIALKARCLETFQREVRR